MCFIDASYITEPTKRRFTTGFDSTFSGAAVVYRSKTQYIIALSSMEACITAAGTAFKTDKFFSSVLWVLGFPQDCPIPIYKDNDPTIDIVKSIIPTERTRCIYVQFFSIQRQNYSGDIIMHNTPGIINPEDDLTKPC